MNCNKCGETKPKEAFHKNISSKSGYRSICKLCRSGNPAETVIDKARKGTLNKEDIKKLIEINKLAKSPPKKILKINSAMIPSDDKINYIKSKLQEYFVENNNKVLDIVLDENYYLNLEVHVSLEVPLTKKEATKILEFLTNQTKHNSIELPNLKKIGKKIEIIMAHVGQNLKISLTIDKKVKIMWNNVLNFEDYTNLMAKLG